MTTKEIQQLIDRYLAAETSAEEERLLALELQREDIPEDWQAVRLMLGELTLGEAVYDKILASRRKRKFQFWRWAAAAVIVLAAGLGVALYRWNAPSQLIVQERSTNETRNSYQRVESVPPVEHVDANSRVSQHDQSLEPARPVASPNANRRKRKVVQPSSAPSSTEMPSPSQEESAEELLLAAAEAELQAMDVQRQPLSPYDDPYAAIEAEMRDIRNRGEHIEAMVAEITRAN